MKKVTKLALIITATMPVFFMTATAATRESAEVVKTAQGIDFTQSVDASRWERFSAQAVYSDGTPSSHTITDGIKSTATISVTGAFVSTQASLTINVSSTSGVSGDSVVLNGVRFLEGTEWAVQSSTPLTAANLAAHIDAHPDFAAYAIGSTVTVRYATVGLSGNGLSATTTDSTNLGLSASTFSGGVGRYTVTINGQTLTEGIDFLGNATYSTTTAVAIKNAINANATLAAQVLASTQSATSGVVYIVALVSGSLGYYAESSTTGFTVANFTAGFAPELDTATDIFTKTNHGLTTGLQVLFSTVSNSSLGGLTNQTTYYAIKLNENQYALATTSTTAAAGTKIDLTSQLGNGSYGILPRALSAAGNTGFFWSVSNDNTNFTALSTVSFSSVTYTAAGNSVWDFGSFNYKYLRVNFTGPTRGGIALTIRMYGIEN